MPKCTKIRKKSRKVCIGDLNDEIKIQNRAINAPVFGNVDFDIVFTDALDIFAAINTVSGKTFFDGISTEIDITHHIYIVFDATINTEKWVEYKNRRFDVLKFEDLDERQEFIKLTCAERGANTIEATKI